jgi:hypothetical protein
VKVYACYTPSHRGLFEEHFVPSLPKCLTADNFGARPLPQQSATGAFQSDGFQATCLAKVGYILEVLAANLGGEPFIFSDVDVRFYGDPTADLMTLLGDKDMLFQDDGPGGACTGFMIMRPTPRVIEFWRMVAKWMREGNQLDQDAANRVLETKLAPSFALLPERYWTVGRNGKVWEPGQPVNPPHDLMVHHANWTVGVENKLALLDAVSVAMADGKGSRVVAACEIAMRAREGNEQDRIHQAVRNIDAKRPVAKKVTGPVSPTERYPFGATHARRILDEQTCQDRTAKAIPDYLAIVLGFWSGDKRRALELSRLIADIEPARRDDVIFVFARQSECPMDAEIEKAQLYVGRKFSFVDMETTVDVKKPYPGIAFDPWASAMAKMSDSYYAGRLDCANSFFLESDGVPLRTTWIDDIKESHRETLFLGKRVTGPRMRFGGHDHINGTMVAHASLWPDRPSLHRCPTDRAWDVFHGKVLVDEAGPSQIILNAYGCTDITAAVFLNMSMESAFLTSVKDRSAFGHAESLLVHRGQR